MKTYKITSPNIPSAGVYYFTTDFGVEYEVRFGRKQDDILSASIVFGVLNEEYEGEEYVITNKGDVFRVMNTISEVVKIFREAHPNVRYYEFTGEPIGNEDENKPTKRLKMYYRYSKRIFWDDWDIQYKGNRIEINKMSEPYY